MSGLVEVLVNLTGQLVLHLRDRLELSDRSLKHRRQRRHDPRHALCRRLTDVWNAKPYQNPP